MKTTSVCLLSCFFGFAAAAFPGMATARGAKTIEVRVLDQGGRELKKDVLER